MLMKLETFPLLCNANPSLIEIPTKRAKTPNPVHSPTAPVPPCPPPRHDENRKTVSRVRPEYQPAATQSSQQQHAAWPAPTVSVSVVPSDVVVRLPTVQASSTGRQAGTSPAGQRQAWPARQPVPAAAPASSRGQTMAVLRVIHSWNRDADVPLLSL